MPPPATFVAPPKGDLAQLARLARFLAPYRGRIAASCVLALGQGLRYVIDAGFGSGEPHLRDTALAAVIAVSINKTTVSLITDA